MVVAYLFKGALRISVHEQGEYDRERAETVSARFKTALLSCKTKPERSLAAADEFMVDATDTELDNLLRKLEVD